MKKQLLALAASFAALFASMVATSACCFFAYQPEEPKCLRDE